MSIEKIPFPNKKYNIIYADPPWQYNDKAGSGKRGAFYKYDLMSMSDLYSLPVKKISADDCILFLWCTFPKLQEGLDLIKKWGFEYKTVAFVWGKLYKNKAIFMGMGGWTRSNSEIVLLGVKGNPKRINEGIRSLVLASPEEHSKKPDRIRDDIVKLCGDLPRIELFARDRKEGWDAWGNQTEKFVKSKTTLLDYM